MLATSWKPRPEAQDRTSSSVQKGEAPERHQRGVQGLRSDDTKRSAGAGFINDTTPGGSSETFGSGEVIAGGSPGRARDPLRPITRVTPRDKGPGGETKGEQTAGLGFRDPDEASDFGSVGDGSTGLQTFREAPKSKEGKKRGPRSAS